MGESISKGGQCLRGGNHKRINENFAGWDSHPLSVGSCHTRRRRRNVSDDVACKFASKRGRGSLFFSLTFVVSPLAFGRMFDALAALCSQINAWATGKRLYHTVRRAAECLLFSVVESIYGPPLWTETCCALTFLPLQRNNEAKGTVAQNCGCLEKRCWWGLWFFVKFEVLSVGFGTSRGGRWCMLRMLWHSDNTKFCRISGTNLIRLIGSFALKTFKLTFPVRQSERRIASGVYITSLFVSLQTKPGSTLRHPLAILAARNAFALSRLANVCLLWTTWLVRISDFGFSPQLSDNN
mmetsp:Transcript_10632/g.24678  ORF Transcript_10632/g.24678 Transcript_10632/m.24678 type:complete len:296 (+) Transcript_10632:1165-2052(+)